MFLLVLSGRVSDRAEARTLWETWQREVAPRTPGWLGDTAGISELGEFVALVRFKTPDAGRRAFTRPDNAAWWQDFAATFDGDLSIEAASDLDAFTKGEFDNAGCVLFVRGRTSQVAEVRKLNGLLQSEARDRCPDIIADVFAWHGDGRFTEAIYFFSEEEARRAEADRPPRLRELSARWATLVSDQSFVGVTEPMHAGAKRESDGKRSSLNDARTKAPAQDLQLRLVAQRLLAGMNEVDAAMILDANGQPIASTLPEGLDEGKISEVSGALLAWGEKALTEIVRGGVELVIAQGSEGIVAAMQGDSERTLVAVASPGAKLGSVLFEMRRTAAQLALSNSSEPVPRGPTASRDAEAGQAEDSRPSVTFPAVSEVPERKPEIIGHQGLERREIFQ
jgi:predicted regulator of Ras-like GTPase activity (Roadblock/LC7/MglB family)